MLVFALTGVGIILMPLFLLVATITAGFGGITAGYLLSKVALENISGFSPDQRSDQLKAVDLATALLFTFSLVPFLDYMAFFILACLRTDLTTWPQMKRMLKLAPSTWNELSIETWLPSGSYPRYMVAVCIS